MLLDIIKLSLKKIKNRLLESIVVIISLGFGLAVVSTVLGLIISFNKQMDENINEPWARQIYISPPEYGGSDEIEVVNKLGTATMGEPVKFTRQKMNEIIKFCPSVDYAFVNDWSRLNEEATEDTDWWDKGHSIATDLEYIKFTNMVLEGGSLFTQEDIDEANNVVILGGNLKKVKFKDQDPIGETITFNDVEYTVIGFFKEKYSNTLSSTQLEDMRNHPWEKNNLYYIPISKSQWLADATSYETFNLGVNNYEDLEQAVNEVKIYIESEYPNGEVNVSSSLDWNDKMNESTIKVLVIIGFIAFIALLIAALTNLNLMLARVIREKKGLGISIALGSSKKTLFTSLVTESSIIGVIGAVLGLIITFLLNIALKGVFQEGGSIVSAAFSIENILINLGVAVLVTALFSIIPALEAIKVSPSQVLRED